MNDNLSLSQLESMLQLVHGLKPQIDGEARMSLGPVAELIDRVGLPVTEADWFHVEEELHICKEVAKATYIVNGNCVEIGNAVQIGRNDFGRIVIECNKGHVVYVDETGETQLINSSLETFLFFVARFHQSAAIGYRDVSQLRSDCETVDMAPLRDPNGVWSVTIEEAEAGLY